MDYSKILSSCVQQLKPSGIRKFFDLANAMEGVISLGVGEPDFRTPYAIRRAGMPVAGKGLYLVHRQRGPGGAAGGDRPLSPPPVRSEL